MQNCFGLDVEGSNEDHMEKGAEAQPGKNFGGGKCWAKRTEGAKRSRIEGEAQTEGEARDRAGEGSGEGAPEPLPNKFLKI